MLALAGCGGAAAPSAPADPAARIGVLAPCGANVASFPRQVARACPATVDRARKLIEGDGVDVVLAYPTDEQGFALALYAETQADITFVDGASALPETTLDVQARNYFRFAPDRRQRAAGLGSYAFRELGRRRMRLRTPDGYARDAFTVEFCALGGTPGVPTALPVRARAQGLDAALRLRRALAATGGSLDGLRDELARGLDENRQVVAEVRLLRGRRVVATYRGVEQTFGGAFTEEDARDYRPPCERREPPPWAR